MGEIKIMRYRCNEGGGYIFRRGQFLKHQTSDGARRVFMSEIAKKKVK